MRKTKYHWTYLFSFNGAHRQCVHIDTAMHRINIAAIPDEFHRHDKFPIPFYLGWKLLNRMHWIENRFGIAAFSEIAAFFPVSSAREFVSCGRNHARKSHQVIFHQWFSRRRCKINMVQRRRELSRFFIYHRCAAKFHLRRLANYKAIQVSLIRLDCGKIEGLTANTFP